METGVGGIASRGGFFGSIDQSAFFFAQFFVSVRANVDFDF